jgi:hypothetical protein
LVLAASCATLAAVGCGDVNKALEQLSESRRLAADLHVQFAKATDATNRSVMADTDESSVAYAREAEQAKQAIARDAAALKPLLVTLRYDEELRHLDAFSGSFAEYGRLDASILELAGANTNLKAQRLSFGPALQEADALRDALEAVRPANLGEAWRVKALAASAVAAVREVQALQAPHIADRDDAVMDRIERRMSAADAEAAADIAALGRLADAPSRAKVAEASEALDRFRKVHAEAMALSRRNTNVRSLMLALDQKQKLTAPCEESLAALRDRLAKRGYQSSRY